MARTYKVSVTAGSHTWTVTDLDPPQAGLMDPLTIGWSMPEDQQRPTQPDVMVATFSVVAATAADLDDLVLGARVTITVTFGPVDKPTPDISFYGSIAQGEAQPHKAAMLYRFTCADLTTALAGLDIGAVAYPVQSVSQRLTALITTAGLADSAVVRDPIIAPDANLMVEKIDDPNAADLLSSLIALADALALPGPTELAGVNHRPIVAPYPGGKWALDALPDAYVPTALTPLPGQFGKWFPDPDAYGLKLDPADRAAGVIDACVIDFDADWVAIQPGVVNRATITWLLTHGFGLDTDNEPFDRYPVASYYQQGQLPDGQTPVTATRKTGIIAIGDYITPGSPTYVAATANLARLGAMMIPPPQNPAGWGPDAFRWLLYKDPAGLANFPVIFPRHDATTQPTPLALRTAAYVRPITITRLPAKWNAADATQDWYAGQLTAVLLTIESGRPVVDFQLVPTIPDQGNPDTGTRSWNTRTGTWNAQTGAWNDLSPGRVGFRWSDAALAGVTWNQMHRPQSWDMYRLARGS